jgi:transposase InsO family protein
LFPEFLCRLGLRGVRALCLLPLDRRLAGRHEPLYTDLALDALQMAIWRRQATGADLTGLVHHSDRGVQYRAVRYTQRLAQGELIRNRGPWRGIDDVEIATVEYIDWDNNRRLHGELGHLPPAEHEAPHAMTHTRSPQPRKPDNRLSIKPGT